MRIWAAILLLAATPAAAQPTSASVPAQTPPQAAESVTVTATPLPHRSAVDDFIYSYPVPVRTTDKIGRWKTGICPVVEGLPQHFAAFITRRLTAIARSAGAPVNADPKCRHNIQIVFTDKPQVLADDLHKNHRPYLGYFDNLNQAAELATVKHAIQAWYLTATVDFHGALYVDNPRANFFNGAPVAQPASTSGIANVGYAAQGGRLNNGISSTLYNVVIVADPSKLGDYEMGSLADYIAMLALSQPKSFDACWEVPSITNLLSRDCEPARKTATISDNDAAFLHGLYKMRADDSVWAQRSEIRYFMERHAANK